MSNAGLFSFATQNLGDEMQSFAVLAHLQRVHRFLDRDHLADWAEEETDCVFNSWFLNGDDFRPPAPTLRPIWHGFAAGRPELLEGNWLEYLRRQGAIGCRDMYSVRLLSELGIESHWTGCLSLFLGTALGRSAARRSGVYFVDLPEEAERFLPHEITREAVRLSTFPPAGSLHSPFARLALVGRLVEVLRRAELVVTRRLHVALPAASFGTPVVAVPDARISWADRRFSGYEEIIPTVFLQDAAEGLRRLDWSRVPAARISPEIADAHDALCGELGRRGLGASRADLAGALDDVGRTAIRVRNMTRIRRPGGVRLRLGSRCFDLPVLFWSDRFVDVALGGFPGLSKFSLCVEACAWGEDRWVPWGGLRDIIAEEPPHAPPLQW